MNNRNIGILGIVRNNSKYDEYESVESLNRNDENS